MVHSCLLKVILADSLETPMFPTNQENKPAGVERIIYASKKMSDASRGLLYHKAGILTGCGGSLACGVAFTLADKIGVLVRSKIANCVCFSFQFMTIFIIIRILSPSSIIFTIDLSSVINL